MRDDYEKSVVAAMPGLYKFAMRLTHKNVSVAEDLVQDTVLRALERREQFREGTSIEAWLFTILKFKHYGDYRTAQRRPTVEDPDQMLANTISLSVDPLVHLEAKEMLKMISSMPERISKPLCMIAVDGATYDEVAIECAMRLGTVKSTVARARQALTSVVLPY